MQRLPPQDVTPPFIFQLVPQQSVLDLQLSDTPVLLSEEALVILLQRLQFHPQSPEVPHRLVAAHDLLGVLRFQLVALALLVRELCLALL